MNIQSNQAAAERIFADINLLEATKNLAQQAGEIRRRHGTHIADAIIAATAIENNAQLATLNTKHFENIPGLKIWKS